MNQSNPYESPTTITDAGPSWRKHWFIRLRKTLFLVTFVPLAATTAWATFSVSPVGVFLPAAIGLLMSLRVGSTLRQTLIAIALAYVVGVSVIVIAFLVTGSIYDPMRLNEDSWRREVTRVWAAFGILGAIAGSFIGLYFGVPKGASDRTEPFRAPERRQRVS